MAWAGWYACINRTDCKSCIDAFTPSVWDSEEKKELKKNGTPCKTCKPEMWVDNYKILNIYSKVSSQVIPSMSGSIAINEIAVLNRINLDKSIKEEDKEHVLDCISMVANKVIFLRNEHSRKQREKK